MGKITKAQSKAHDEALAVLSLTRKLGNGDKEFVFNNFNPMATNNVGKGAIFFTPIEVAWEFRINSESDGNVIDLAAGIGMLSYVHRDSHSNPKFRHVAIELNPEFVDIGRKLLPEVEWYCGSIFDEELLRGLGTDFTLAISNPPFGNIASKTDTQWMSLRGPAELLAIEVALRMAYCGGIFILPSQYANKKENTRNEVDEFGLIPGTLDNDKTREVSKLHEKFGPVHLMPWFSSLYEDASWQGANPNVLIIDVNNDDVSWPRPYDFEKVTQEA